jgi:hypothetical protein
MTLLQKISEFEQAGNLPRLSSIVGKRKAPKRAMPSDFSPGHLLWIDGEEITAEQGLIIRHIDIT